MTTAVVERMAGKTRTTETSLVQLAQGGSVEAFEEIVRLHQRLVRSFIVRHVGNQQVADDLSQDVFVAAFRGIDRYQGKSSIATWLLGIARNMVLTHLRNKSTRKMVPLDLALDDLHLSSLDPDLAEDEAEALRVDALRSCLQALDPDQREILIAFYYREETAEQVGRATKKRPGAIRMLLLRLRKQLRICVENKLRSGGALS